MHKITKKKLKSAAAILLAVGTAAAVSAGVASADQVTVVVDAAISEGLDTTSLVTTLGKYGAGLIGAVAAIKVVKFIMAVIV